MIDMEQLKIIKPRIQSRSGTATRLKRPALANGLAIRNHQGQFYSSRDIDGAMHEVLEDIFEDSRHLFLPNIKTKENWWKTTIVSAHFVERPTPEPRK